MSPSDPPVAAPTPLTDAAVIRRPYLADNRSAAVHGAVVDRLVELGYMPSPSPINARDFYEALLQALASAQPATKEPTDVPKP